MTPRVVLAAERIAIGTISVSKLKSRLAPSAAAANVRSSQTPHRGESSRDGPTKLASRTLHESTQISRRAASSFLGGRYGEGREFGYV